MQHGQTPATTGGRHEHLPMEVRVERAREMFFTHGRDPGDWVDRQISRSWSRCQTAGLVSAQPEPMARPRLLERREQAMRLLECAQPELDFLSEHALNTDCVVILSDASGLILDEIGSAGFLPKAQRIALTPGADWSEDNRGTNAIGTALIERQAVTVLGREHFLSQNGALGCTAAPIFTGRGVIAGVLDISGEAHQITQHASGLVRMAAQQVEHRMMLAQATGHLLRFHVRPSLLGTSREGLLVVEDDRLIAANRVALDLLGSQWEDLLDQPVERLVGLRWTRLLNGASLLTLPDGQQIAAMVEPSRKQTAGSDRFMRRAAPIDAADAVGERPRATAQIATAVADVSAPLLSRAVRVCDDGLPVLVTGETGSGKEVFARRLHGASKRSNGPFVAVNCAALPETLIEAELFGYEPGAFTGARRHGAPGRIRQAHGGVLFLDEIGDMPLALQTRLLRVLEDHKVTPLGSSADIAVDFRLVCATHRDLAAMASEGSFRSDLVYRINGFAVNLPPLRDRSDKLRLIDEMFAEHGASKHVSLHEDARAALARYSWPGNVRELNTVLRTCIALVDEGGQVNVSDLPAHVVTAMQPAAPASVQARPLAPAAAVAHESKPAPDREHRHELDELPADPMSLATVTREAIKSALSDCSGNMAEAARRLGMHRSTLYRRMARGL
ncbi:sigma-54-dependent Fis family transcriptional regulator [soil metagenome]